MAIYKLRMNKALTQSDLNELERMLTASGIGEAKDLEKAQEESHGLRANQIEFVNLIVNQLTDHGVMSASLLYESPFTDLATRGPPA